MQKSVWRDENLIKTLKNGGVCVMPTDTIYGIVGRADKKHTVENIYEIRRRNPERPCIILIGDKKEINKFSISTTKEQDKKINENWPGPVSIILDCNDDSLEYLHRGTKTLAFRLPNNEDLRNLLIETGPLIAPSANPEGYPIAKDCNEALGYFGNAVDYYGDGGIVEGKASKVVKLKNDGSMTVLRE